MATINNIYVFVESEDFSRSSKVPQHPVEKGLPITDNVRNESRTISISGKIVNTSKLTADAIITKLETLRTGGSLIKYSGKNIVGNFMIKSFDTSHPNTNWGGADFSMELLEVRIAKSAYNAKKSKQKKAEATKKVNNPTLKVGAKVVFKGGSVYASSDAKTAAAKRSRSTCKITIINSKSWSVHDYHLISTDGKKVYGWVDKANIEGTGSGAGTKATNTGKKTNGGTQQVKKTSGSAGERAREGLKYVGKTTAQKNVGGDSYFESRLYKVDSSWYYKDGDYYYPKSDAKSKMERGKNRTWYFPSGTPYYQKRKTTTTLEPTVKKPTAGTNILG